MNPYKLTEVRYKATPSEGSDVIQLIVNFDEQPNRLISQRAYLEVTLSYVGEDLEDIPTTKILRLPTIENHDIDNVTPIFMIYNYPKSELTKIGINTYHFRQYLDIYPFNQESDTCFNSSHRIQSKILQDSILGWVMDGKLYSIAEHAF